MKIRACKLHMGILLLCGLGILMLAGRFLLPYAPTELSVGARLSAPSLRHLFGTDHLGRDVFVRVSHGALWTMVIALGAVGIGAVFGLVMGAIAGYYGGIFDAILMRLADLLAAFPSVLLALIAISLTGTGTWRFMLILGVLFIPSFARIIRGEFRRVRGLDYVSRARLMGASDFRIMRLHIFPNTLAAFLSALAIGFNNAVLAEASMSFLGLGVLPPRVSLGRMLSEASAYIFTAPWIAFFTGLFLSLFVLAFALIAAGILQAEVTRDA